MARQSVLASHPVQQWDGQSLLTGLVAAADSLIANRDRVNVLNVFPVADGDTGTNMALTMRAAVDEVQRLDEGALWSAQHVAASAAHGALMGARGNSGVILSQVFRGFANSVSGLDTVDGPVVVRSLASARDMAYAAVTHPVEGTMLTVIRVAAERAAAAETPSSSLAAILAIALDGAREALAATPEMLDVLREAGVVDAGGYGLVLILEGLLCAARGEPVPTAPSADDGLLGAEMAFLDRIDELHGEGAVGYCTNFMVFAREDRPIDLPCLRDELVAHGESAVIVGDDTVAKVHIHTLNPGKVLDDALQWGELGQIKIDNMNAQTEALVAQRQAAIKQPTPIAAERPLGRQAVLAVASGEGLSRALSSMGATVVLPGGHTMNPSVEELLAAVNAAPCDEVILLPNDPNVVLVADRALDQTTKRVRIVLTRSVPQGIAALAAFTADAELAANVAAMSDALATVRTVEITRADKNLAVDGLPIAPGQVIGFLDGVVVAGGDDAVEVTCQTLAKADLAAAELVTIFAGDDARPDETEEIGARIERERPNVTVEVYDGGQPRVQYVIAVE